jgi:GNAT superfamily N-acetyltransferase
MVTYREMSLSELERIAEIDVTESGTHVYTWSGGEQIEQTQREWQRPARDFAGWQRGTWTVVLKCEGLRLIGAFDDDNALVGFALMRPKLSETTAQLALLYVSRAYRRGGVARALVEQVAEWARESGAQTLYVSATPTESAVSFYRSQGFVPTAQPNPELFALEPKDIHMLKPL